MKKIQASVGRISAFLFSFGRILYIFFFLQVDDIAKDLARVERQIFEVLCLVVAMSVARGQLILEQC